MKIALITDTHWGIRNDNVVFLENNKKFMDNIFLPYLDNFKIKRIIHLGDIVDRRKYINYFTAKRLREDFLEPLNDRGIEMDIIAGNHDTYFKNTNEVNALNELIQGKYNNFRLYTSATHAVNLEDSKILFVPWICDENREETIGIIDKSDAKVVMGHLELAGFQMYKGATESHGDDPKIFNKFDIVMSGHYHHRSNRGNVFYLGSHSEFTWSDYDDPRGFHIFDTVTNTLEFIENPYRLFKKIWYNDASENFSLDNFDFSEYENCIIKVIVQEKNNSFLFDKFMEKIEHHKPVEVQIVEDNLNLNLENDEDIINEAESTIGIFKKYIEALDQKNVNKKKLELKIIEIYNEAMSLE